ncbi:MAG TPA: glycosyltransferase family 4 protein, partial [Nannocystaceae bacterium]|nr:glycosyltransferase family 4 protein [Nannocystaceae bacterium]
MTSDESRTRPAAAVRAPRLLYLVTEDWYFCSHRLPMARAARDAGFRVAVATRCADHAAQIRDEGFELHPLRWRRRSLDPISAARDIAEIAALYAELGPDLVHHVALKPVVYGSIAAGVSRIPRVVNALTGFGFAFGSRGRVAAAIGRIARPTLRRLLRRRGSVVVVQNESDAQRLGAEGLVDPAAIRLVRGSGVDLRRFAVLPDPPQPFTIGFVGRMLADKGVPTLLEAHALLRARGLPIALELAGAPDRENPTSLDEHELRARTSVPGVRWLHHVADVREVWRRCHVAVLPSRHEGLPLALLEAAACGRALVASDVSGCRELATHEDNALLVPPDDAVALADAIERLFHDRALRLRLAARSRARVIE